MTLAGTGCPTHCRLCGQKLMFLAPDRDVCSACLAGHTHQAVAKATGGTVQRPEMACRGCGRSRLDGHDAPLALTDGYCLVL